MCISFNNNVRQINDIQGKHITNIKLLITKKLKTLVYPIKVDVVNIFEKYSHNN